MNFSQPLNFHSFFPALGTFQESKQLSRGHTPAMDAQDGAGLGEACLVAHLAPSIYRGVSLLFSTGQALHPENQSLADPGPQAPSKSDQVAGKGVVSLLSLVWESLANLRPI